MKITINVKKKNIKFNETSININSNEFYIIDLKNKTVIPYNIKNYVKTYTKKNQRIVYWNSPKSCRLMALPPNEDIYIFEKTNKIKLDTRITKANLLRSNKYTINLNIGKNTVVKGDNLGGLIGFVLKNNLFELWNKNLLSKINDSNVVILDEPPKTPQAAIGFKGWFNIPRDAMIHPLLLDDYKFNNSIFIQNYIAINPDNKVFYISKNNGTPDLFFEMPYSISQPQTYGTIKWILKTQKEMNHIIIPISQDIEQFYPLQIIYPFIEDVYKKPLLQPPKIETHSKTPKKPNIILNSTQPTEIIEVPINNDKPHQKKPEEQKSIIFLPKTELKIDSLNQQNPPINLINLISKAYVMNLKTRPDRKAKMEYRLKSIGLEKKTVFTEAYNGKDNPSNIIYNRNELLPGELGYIISMQRILMDAIINNYEWIMCMDDDCIFHKDFSNIVDKTLENINLKKMLAIYLGASQYSWRNVKINSKMNGYKCLDTTGSFCVLYNIKLFLPLLVLSRDYSKSFDMGVLMPVLNRNQNQTFVCYPNIVIADVRDSDIRPPKDIYQEARLLRWDLKQFNL